MLPDWFPYSTHATVTGSSQLGKSKFLEHSMREHAIARNGFCLIDWHGTLYQAVLNFLAFARPDRPIYLLNPSQPTYVRPFNPFALPEWGDVSAHVTRLADVIVKPWGAENTNELPTYERIVKMVLTFMAVSGEPLHHGAKLLELPKKELREYAISCIEDDYTKQQWKQLQYIHTFREWVREVESTQNRLGRFIGSRSVKLFTGLRSEAIDIGKIIRERAILLVNLKPSPMLPDESGRVFAALLLSEFLHHALNHTDEEQPYFLYLDEAQNYLTGDAAKILDQVLKTGLRLTLAFHHKGQFHDNLHLQQSLETNAKIKVIFGGLPAYEAKAVAEDLFMAELNERWIKEIRYRTVTEHYLESYDTDSRTETHLPGDETSSSTSSSSSTRWVPSTRQEEAGKDEWSRDEKVSKLAQRLMSLPRQHCYVKLPDRTFEYPVPTVKEYLLNPDTVLRFEEALQRTAIPLHEADELLRREERIFLERGKEYESRGGRPKKRPARLHPQG
jgi:hypothetical protein